MNDNPKCSANHKENAQIRHYHLHLIPPLHNRDTLKKRQKWFDERAICIRPTKPLDTNLMTLSDGFWSLAMLGSGQMFAED